MKKFNLPTVASAAFVATLFCLRPEVALAGGQGFSQDVYRDSKATLDSKEMGLGKFASFPFHVSVSVRGGYDDNVNLAQFNTQNSGFINGALALTYNFGGPRTQLSLTAGTSVTYYFDREDQTGATDQVDVNAYVAFAVTHRATPRLTLTANLYGTYVSQPDFQTFNNNNAVAFGRQSQDFFFTIDKFSVGYAWTPRFSTVSSYTVGYTNYDDAVISVFQDRFEHTLGNEFRFLVLPTTSAIAEYRLGLVDYSEVGNRDSTAHYFLLGLDHSFSPRFNLSARGGVEFREYCDNGVFGNNGGDQTSPYGELTANYAVAQNTNVSLTGRYSIEQSDVPELLSRQTFRTSISLRHNFTSRIVAGLNFAYQNDDYDGNAVLAGFTEDSFDVSLSLRYAITRNWALDAGYTHTEVVSDDALFRSYSRNRVYAGATFTF